MKAIIRIGGRNWETDLASGFDLSVPIGKVRCFHAPQFRSDPVRAGDFVGSVLEGSPVNFYNIFFNPHAHGTHTECLGHITRTHERLADCIKETHVLAKLITITPEKCSDKDKVITASQLMPMLKKNEVNSLIIRTKPNDSSKLKMDYSGTNPTYFSQRAMEYIVASGIDHLLIDLPSVDKEQDGGKLISHKIFWNMNGGTGRRFHATITELIYVPDTIPDGYYLLNLQWSSFDMDAVPSRPVIYPVIQSNENHEKE